MKNIRDFSSFRNGNDWTSAVREALASGGDGLVFPEGEYHFYPETGERRYCFFTNHDEGMKLIAFFLKDLHDFHISGENARFVFHGRTTPFVLSNCSNIRLDGFSIDFERSFIPSAEVLEVSTENTILRFPEPNTFLISEGKLCFIPDEYRFFIPKIPWLAYDIERKEPAFNTPSGCFGRECERLSSDMIRIRNVIRAPEQGAQIVLKPEPRLFPAVAIDDSSEIQLSDLTIFHSCGMGILAQNSRDIAMRDIRIRTGENRLISVPDDALHCSQCSGTIQLDHCSFENGWDDAVNIHGVYRKFRNRGGALLEAGHFQQFGVPMARSGETLEIGTVRAKVKSIIELNKQYAMFIPEEPLPDIPDGTLVLNMDRQPRVTIRDCRFIANKPRGVLVTTAGKTLIEHNEFHTPGAAIYLAGGSDFWYESGPVRDMTIRKNLFRDCLYQGFSTGRAVIDIVAPAWKQDVFHRGIRIEENLFSDSHNKLVSASNCGDLFISGNRHEDSTVYSCSAGEPWDFTNCIGLVLNQP